MGFCLGEALLREEGNHAFGLIVADFEGDQSVRCKMLLGLGNETINDIEALHAAVEGSDRIVPDFAGQAGDFVRINVREICDNEVKWAAFLWPEVGFVGCEAPGEVVAGDVFPGERKGRGRRSVAVT